MKSRDEAPTEWYLANDKLEEKIRQVLNKLHWYDRQMFVLVATGPDSMRKIARDSKISLSSISNTINKCRRKLKDELGEDFEDYFNKEYKRIKK